MLIVRLHMIIASLLLISCSMKQSVEQSELESGRRISDDSYSEVIWNGHNAVSFARALSLVITEQPGLLGQVAECFDDYPNAFLGTEIDSKASKGMEEREGLVLCLSDRNQSLVRAAIERKPSASIQQQDFSRIWFGLQPEDFYSMFSGRLDGPRWPVAKSEIVWLLACSEKERAGGVEVSRQQIELIQEESCAMQYISPLVNRILVQKARETGKM